MRGSLSIGLRSTSSPVVGYSFRRVYVTSVRRVVGRLSYGGCRPSKYANFHVGNIVQRVVVGNGYLTICNATSSSNSVRSLLDRILPRVATYLVRFFVFMGEDRFYRNDVRMGYASAISCYFFLLVSDDVYLIVFSIVRVRVGIGPTSFFPLFSGMVQVFSALFGRVSNGIFMVFFSNCFVRARGSRLSFLVSQGTHFFAFFYSGAFPSVFYRTLRCVGRAIFSDRLVMDHHYFRRVSNAMWFVTFLWILPTIFQLFSHRGDVRVAIVLLHFFGSFGGLVYAFFRFDVQSSFRYVHRAFRPFNGVAILRGRSMGFALFRSHYGARIYRYVTLFRSQGLVVWCFLLVEGCYVRCRFLVSSPRFVHCFCLVRRATLWAFFRFYTSRFTNESKRFHAFYATHDSAGRPRDLRVPLVGHSRRLRVPDLFS